VEWVLEIRFFALLVFHFMALDFCFADHLTFVVLGFLIWFKSLSGG